MLCRVLSYLSLIHISLILLIVLIVSAFLLIVLKLAQFVNHFSRKKQYLLTEMSRAADDNEYRYWQMCIRDSP